MAAGQKYIPQSIDMDKQETLVPATAARYIKNLVYSLDDTSLADAVKGGQVGVYKPAESNAVYVDDFIVPRGTIQSVGEASYRETKQAFIMTYSSLGNHGLFRINGTSATIDTVFIGKEWNFQLRPEFFIAGEGGSWLEVLEVSDPITGQKRIRSFLFFTDGFNEQRFICVEDAIATNGFDPVKFPYFKGNYERKVLISMGSPTPKDCIKVTEVPLDQDSVQLSNDLLYNTKQFRIRYIDVWGRPSEYGIISDTYVPGGGGCIEASTNLPRCLDLEFNAPPPHINQVEIAYRNCNDNQWYTSDTLDLYNGSPLGDWWLRSRNSKVNFNPNTNKITYRFCADEGCDPIDPALTNRSENPLPRTSQSIEKIGSFIGLGNNKEGFLPFSQDLKDKITMSILPPASTSNSARNIEVFVEIYSPFLSTNQPIFYDANGAGKKQYGFGGEGAASIVGLSRAKVMDDYKQFFLNPNQSGFVGVLAGTGAYAISEQYAMDATGNFTKVTDFSTIGKTTTAVKYFQKFTFSNLNPQTYILRIASHQTDPTTDANYAKTSTYLRGAFKSNFSNLTSPVDHSSIVDDSKELIIDVCNEDYSSLKDNRILVVYDLTFKTAVRAGYVRTTSDATKDPIGVELLNLGFTSPQRIDSKYTDHNGFFFCATQASGHGSTYNINGFCNCKYISLTGGIDTGSGDNLIINNWDLNTITSCPNYGTEPCNYILIKGKVVICGTNVGVPGVGVVLTRGGIATTDNNGEFTIIAHDDCNGPSASYISSSIRHDRLFYITSACPFTDCDGGCITPINVDISKCTSCLAREVDAEDTFVQFVSLKGLLSGGTYPWSVTGYDWSGRRTFSQPLGNLSIPPVSKTLQFAPSILTMNIADDAVFPDGIDYITVGIGQESTISDYIDWIVDSVLFVDNTGLENTTSPTQVKIYYASLIEYNKQNNYNTTVNWSFLESNPNSTTQTPVTTDRVQFLVNGDGTFFSKNIVSLVKYDQAGQFFLINYSPDLANLKDNARIRLFRPKQCTTAAPYFETCSVIDIVNKKAITSSVILNAFDTYYISRGIIPVPVPQDTNPVTYVNEGRLQGLPFEHNSPSDFWGQGCANLGRVNAKNDQETVLYKKDDIALSDALSPNGQLNFLCFFEDARKISFSDTAINGITAIVSETSVVLVIGQDDHFIVGFNDNLVRVNADGTAQAASISNTFGKPVNKVGQNWGCQLFDKNTIYKKEGFVHWLDTAKVAIVQHNFGRAINLAKFDPVTGVPGGVDSWIRPKVKYVQNYNLANGNKRYFHGIVNPQSMEYILTDFTIGNSSPVNTLRQKEVSVNETMSVGIFTKLWKAAHGFVPEMFTEIEGELDSQQFFSLFKGIPYSHYNDVSIKSYGKMFGVNMVRVMEPIIVLDNMIKKKPLSIGVICKQGQYFVDRAINEAGQETRMLLSAWIQAEYGWYAPFLCDIHTPFDPNLPDATGKNVLMDGNMLVGNFIKIRLIGDPSNDNEYSEFQGIIVSVFADGNNLLNK